jgi:hypothetical protein
VRERTETFLYVHAPFKVDLRGDFTYQHTWLPMLQGTSGCTPSGLPGNGGDLLDACKRYITSLLTCAESKDYVGTLAGKVLYADKGTKR